MDLWRPRCEKKTVSARSRTATTNNLVQFHRRNRESRNGSRAAPQLINPPNHSGNLESSRYRIETRRP